MTQKTSCTSVRNRSIEVKGPKRTRTTDPSRKTSDPETVALQFAPGPSAGGGGAETPSGLSAGGGWVRLPVSRRTSACVAESSSTSPTDRLSTR